MNNLIVAGAKIRINKNDLYSLNDLHKAAGGLDKDKPSHWLANIQTKDLVAELSNSSDPSNKVIESRAGRYGGTYAAEVLCIAYAEWVCGAKFTAKLLSSIPDAARLISAVSNIEIPDDLPDMFIYVVREADTGNVKIGISRNPTERVRILQIGNSSKLELIAVKSAGNRFADEKKAHLNNADHKIHGEWFTGEASIGENHE